MLFLFRFTVYFWIISIDVRVVWVSKSIYNIQCNISLLLSFMLIGKLFKKVTYTRDLGVFFICFSFLFQIKRYYAFKIKHSNIYDNLTPSKETNIFKQNILVVFPNRDQLGRRILLLELGSKYFLTKPIDFCANKLNSHSFY